MLCFSSYVRVVLLVHIGKLSETSLLTGSGVKYKSLEFYGTRNLGN